MRVKRYNEDKTGFLWGDEVMWINILMAACMYPTLLIVYVVLKNEIKTTIKRPGKAMTLFGVQLSHEQMTDPEIDEVLERFNKEMKQMFIIIAIFPVLAFFMPWFSISFSIWMMWLFVIFILLFVPIVRGNRRVKAVKRRRGWYDPEELSDSPDDHWYLGMIYYNPKDQHTMIKKPSGLGSTINMARPAGKAVAVLIIVSLLSLPVICGWIIMQEFVPIHLTLDDETLTATQIIDNYTIPVDQIENLELLRELPRWSKVSGTNMDNLLKGTFENRTNGDFEVFLNPQNSVFISFHADGTLYYMSGQNDEETMAVYNRLKGSRLEDRAVTLKALCFPKTD